MTSKEIEVIEDLIELIHPFFQLTEIMSGTKYVTISSVLPGVTRLLEILQIYNSKFKNQEIEKLAIVMHDNLFDRTREYFNNSTVMAATFLDPRYRKFKFIKDEKERKTILTTAKDYISSTYLSKFKDINFDDSTQKQAKRARLETNKDKNNFNMCDSDICDESLENISISYDSMQEIKNVIRDYESMTIKVHEKSNPLEFYKINQILLKRLSVFSKMIFSITASSVPSESTFSNAQDIISDDRSRLTPHHAEELLMISQNKKLGLKE